LAELGKQVKTALGTGMVQIVGAADVPIRRLAIACGAAGEFLNDARRTRADAFLTGEMRFHDYLRAKEMGIALILPGHYATERAAVVELAAMLQRQWPGLAIAASQRESDPVVWL
jgi:putative NIF3 family GTP cyclohydrolase 1 type 2